MLTMRSGKSQIPDSRQLGNNHRKDALLLGYTASEVTVPDAEGGRKSGAVRGRCEFGSLVIRYPPSDWFNE